MPTSFLRSQRIIILLLFLLAPLCTADEPGGGILVEKRPEKTFALITDEIVAQKLRRATELLQRGEKESGDTLLREVIDMDVDRLICVPRGAKHGMATWEYTYASTEAGKIIKAFQREDIDISKLLEAAKKPDMQRLYLKAITVCPWSKPARDGLRDLAASLADSGDFMAAAVYYDRLAERFRSYEDWELPAIYRAMLVYRRCHSETKVKDILEVLRENLKAGQTLEIGKRKLTLQDVEKELKAATGDAQEPIEMPTLFGGSLRRTAQSVGGTPVLDQSLWVIDTIHEAVVRKVLDRDCQQQLDDHQPILPGFVPVAGANFSLPVVMYPSHLGVHCINAQSGKLKWEADGYRSPDRLGKSGIRWNPFAATLEPAARGGRREQIWENSVVATLSSDNSQLYTIDDLFWVPSYDWELRDYSKNYQPAEDLTYNSLRGFDISSGKIKWSIGGHPWDKHTPDEFKGSYFLGAPLPLDDKLFVLNEQNRVIRLLCLDIRNHNPLKESPIVWQTSTSRTARAIRCRAVR